MIARNKLSCRTDILENLVIGDKVLVRHAEQEDLEASVFMNDPFMGQLKVTILSIDGIVELQYENVINSFRSMVSSKSLETLNNTKIPRSVSLDVGKKSKVVAEKVKLKLLNGYH